MVDKGRPKDVPPGPPDDVPPDKGHRPDDKPPVVKPRPVG